jgi:hypothetical protein
MIVSDAHVREYLGRVEQHYRAGNATENSYRVEFQQFLQVCDAGIIVTNEPKRVKCGAPDYVIERGAGATRLTVGYVEAKDVGFNLEAMERDAKLAEPKTREGKQLKRYLRALDNLVLTNYLEFRWYVRGEKRLTGTLAEARERDRRLVLEKDGARDVLALLGEFLAQRPEEIRRPQELAQRMARLAHMIRDIIIEAFEEREASDVLGDLYRSFKEVLLPELTAPEFADMFAQTLAYGLFAARYNHKGRGFSRDDAAREIPRTNPFLRRLFSTIAGPDLDDEPYAGFVDDLARMLAVTDMESVLADFGKLTRQEDPIVHFYETFLAQYDPKLRELRGVYYTPEPVVSYIVRSVDALLRTHFDCPDGLADTSTVTYAGTDEQGKPANVTSPRVLLLDPACGTGTFLYEVIEHIRESYRQAGNAGMWSGYVREHLLPRLFGFELLMAPYAMAHLKLGMQLAAIDLPPAERATWAYDFSSDERLGLYLTNTLEEAMKRSNIMFGRFISDEANEAAKVKQDYPVMVVLGNPPYSYQSANTGKWISNLIRDYYFVDGQPLGERNPKGLQDDYVKFLRFAQWRIEQTGYGILAFITNHGYLNNPTFRGMRQSLMQTFDEIYVLDLHGNSKKKEKAPDGSKDENVFDIQQGVAIGIFVKHQNKKLSSRLAKVHHTHLWGVREIYRQFEANHQLVGGKYHWLAEHSVFDTEWEKLNPQAPFYLFEPQNITFASEYEQAWKVTDILLVNTPGLVTARDVLTIHWNQDEVWRTVTNFASLPNEEAREQYDLGVDTRDWKVELAQKDLKATGLYKSRIQPIAYRPFDTRFTYFTGNTRGFLSMPRNEVMSHMLLGKNKGLVTVRQVAEGIFNHVIAVDSIVDNRTTLSNKGYALLLPLYLYPEPNEKGLFDFDEPSTAPGGRRPNLSPEFIEAMSGKLGMRFVRDGRGDLRESFGPEDVFHYMYAVFHSPQYRERYAEFLKIDFPRLPLTSDAELFRALCALGERLVGLHLMEQFGMLAVRYPVPGNNVVEKVEFLVPKDAPDKGKVYINKTQYFEGVPEAVWNFHVGGYQVCAKWLKDRKGRALSFDDIRHYQRVAAALAETMTLMERVDEVIEEHGGWPLG